MFVRISSLGCSFVFLLLDVRFSSTFYTLHLDVRFSSFGMLVRFSFFNFLPSSFQILEIVRFLSSI